MLTKNKLSWRIGHLPSSSLQGYTYSHVSATRQQPDTHVHTAHSSQPNAYAIKKIAAPKRADCALTPNSSPMPPMALEYSEVLKFIDTCTVKMMDRIVHWILLETICIEFRKRAALFTTVADENNTLNTYFFPGREGEAQLIVAVFLGDLVAVVGAVLFVEVAVLLGHGVASGRVLNVGAIVGAIVLSLRFCGGARAGIWLLDGNLVPVVHHG